jgi:uncharacterized membrane protein YfcA
MSYVVVCLTALVVSGLTLFSGFGLGTLLMPAFALFFPVEVAVGATAVVHLANNLFKVALVGRRADLRVVLRFALPAAVAAVCGALLLTWFADLPDVVEYTLAGKRLVVTPVKLVMGLLIVGFGVLELSPRADKLAFDPRLIPVGGLLSGFFGGLSGHQGALRSAFLLRAGLSKEAFIGTGVVAAVVVDLTRLLVYGVTIFSGHLGALEREGMWGLVLAGTLAAFAGAFTGKRLMKKVTLRSIQAAVGVMLILLGIAIGAGMV